MVIIIIIIIIIIMIMMIIIINDQFSEGIAYEHEGTNQKFLHDSGKIDTNRSGMF